MLEILARAAPADRPFLEPRRVPAWAAASPAPSGARRAHPGGRERFFTDRRVTVAASDLAAALGAYALAGWRWEKHGGLPAGASERHRVLYGILDAGAGRALGWRRIAETLQTARNGIAVSPADAVEKAAPARPRCHCASADR